MNLASLHTTIMNYIGINYTSVHWTTSFLACVYKENRGIAVLTINLKKTSILYSCDFLFLLH